MPPGDSLKPPGSDELGCSVQVSVGFTFSHYKPMLTSSCHSNQFILGRQIKRMCIISTLLSIQFHVASFMRKEHVVFKLLQDPLFPTKSQWKLQVAIATKVLVGLTKRKNMHSLHFTIYPFIKFHQKIPSIFKLMQDIHNFSHYKSVEQKLQVDIATKIYSG